MSALPFALRWLATPFVAPYVAWTRQANLQQLTQTAVGLGLPAVKFEGYSEYHFQGEVDGIRVHVDPVSVPLVYVLFATQKPLLLDWQRDDCLVDDCEQFEPPDPAFRKVFRRSLIELSFDGSVPKERLAQFTADLLAFSERWRGDLDHLRIDSAGIHCYISYVPLARTIAPKILEALVPDVVNLVRCFDIFGGGQPVPLKGHFPEPLD